MIVREGLAALAERETPPWFKVGQFLFLIGLAVADFSSLPKHNTSPLFSRWLGQPV
jgi:hypothetical protein